MFTGTAGLSLSALLLAVVLTAYGMISTTNWQLLKRQGTMTDTTIAVMQAARRRTLVAICFTLLLVALGVASSQLLPGLLGLPLALTPALAASGGLVLYAATPPPYDREKLAHYSASLTPRHPWSVAPRFMVIALMGTIMLLLGVLIFTGLTSHADGSGLYREISFATATRATSSSPYPGWYYGAPLIASTVILAVSAWFALRRIAATPSLPGADFEAVDQKWRSESARITMGIALSAVCFQLGGVGFFGGIELGGALFQMPVAAWWHLAASCLFWVGVIAALLCVVNLTWVGLRALALPLIVARTYAASHVPQPPSALSKQI